MSLRHCLCDQRADSCRSSVQDRVPHVLDDAALHLAIGAREANGSGWAARRSGVHGDVVEPHERPFCDPAVPGGDDLSSPLHGLRSR